MDMESLKTFTHAHYLQLAESRLIKALKQACVTHGPKDLQVWNSVPAELRTSDRHNDDDDDDDDVQWFNVHLKAD